MWSGVPLIEGALIGKRPFHFHTLGYSQNPFGALTEEMWAAIAVLPQNVAQVLADETVHAQLLGPMGCGKTTTLQKAVHMFRESNHHVAYEYIAEGENKFVSSLSTVDLFVLDEAQRLNWWMRRRWLNCVANGRLRTIFSSHKDLSRAFRRRGLPLKTIEVHQLITLAHYESILHQRLAYFTLPNQPAAMLTEDAVRFLYISFGPDLREAEYFLYEVWQGLDKVEMITAQKLAVMLGEYGRSRKV
ncbi:MAG: ATP-binding protein [Chloroflexi bacterium]|nr:ATP-binding protein [Chloroflexota bacterium]